MQQTETFRVQWVDTDASGRIHYTAAFRWAEATEAALFRRLGVLRDYGLYPRRHVEAQFLRMLVFGDEVEVDLKVERIGTTSITFRWLVSSNENVAIEGTHTVVYVNRDARPEPLGAEIRAALTAAPS